MNIQPKAILDNKHKIPEEKVPPKFDKKPEPVKHFELKKQNSEEAKGIINVNLENKKKDQKDINDFLAKKLEQKK
jgi:hypothetical protein